MSSSSSAGVDMAKARDVINEKIMSVMRESDVVQLWSAVLDQKNVDTALAKGIVKQVEVSREALVHIRDKQTIQSNETKKFFDGVERFQRSVPKLLATLNELGQRTFLRFKSKLEKDEPYCIATMNTNSELSGVIRMVIDDDAMDKLADFCSEVLRRKGKFLKLTSDEEQDNDMFGSDDSGEGDQEDEDEEEELDPNSDEYLISLFTKYLTAAGRGLWHRMREGVPRKKIISSNLFPAQTYGYFIEGLNSKNDDNATEDDEFVQEEDTSKKRKPRMKRGVKAKPPPKKRKSKNASTALYTTVNDERVASEMDLFVAYIEQHPKRVEALLNLYHEFRLKEKQHTMGQKLTNNMKDLVDDTNKKIVETEEVSRKIIGDTYTDEQLKMLQRATIAQTPATEDIKAPDTPASRNEAEEPTPIAV